MICPCEYDHPTRDRKLSEGKFVMRFRDIWELFDVALEIRCRDGGAFLRAQLHPSRLRDGMPYIYFTPELSFEHRFRNHRRYAQVDTQMLDFEFAPEVLLLPDEHQLGLVCHEIGHCLAPEGTEDDADQAAHEFLGVKIEYDRRWPGKGLQRASFF